GRVHEGRPRGDGAARVPGAAGERGLRADRRRNGPARLSLLPEDDPRGVHRGNGADRGVPVALAFRRGAITGPSPATDRRSDAGAVPGRGRAAAAADADAAATVDGPHAAL